MSTQKIAGAKESIEEGLKIWDPAKDPLAEVRTGLACCINPALGSTRLPEGGFFSSSHIHLSLQGDPFKTLFVARVSYDATEKKLKREFEEYGPVKRVRLVTQKDSGT